MNRIKLCLASFTLALALSPTLQAQDREAGLFLGTAQYQGDLSQKQLTISETRPSIGIFGRYYFTPRIDVKGNLYYGWVEGDDNNYSQDRYRPRRNLNFRSDLVELSSQLEINFLPFIANSRRYRFTPYAFGGVALYYFNPTARYNGTKLKLADLNTEGQGLEGGPADYSKIQGAIPYGLGLKWNLGRLFNIGLEVGQRKLFTDYLDDVSGSYYDNDVIRAKNGDLAALAADPSRIIDPKLVHSAGTQRGDEKDLDLYIFAGITLSKTFRSPGCINF